MKLISRTSKRLILSAILAGSTLTTNFARAQDAPAAKPNPVLQTPAGKAAYQLLKDSAAAYRALNSYSSTITSEDIGGGTAQGRVLWQKPNKVMAEIQQGAVTRRNFLNNGKLVQVEVKGETARYSVSEDDATEPKDVIDDLDPFLFLGRFLSGTTVFDLYKVGSQESAVKAISVRNAIDTDTKGLDEAAAKLQVIEFRVEIINSKTTIPGIIIMTYIINKKDKLARRFFNTGGFDDKKFSFGASYTKVKVNPVLKAADFTFVPTTTAKLVADLNPPPLEDNTPRYNPALKVGATPLELKAIDLAGKPISFDDYKGKVVLVDFWATWCGPCREEMPNVIAAYNKYHDKGFDIVSISSDSDKAPLEKYIADNKMPWRQVFAEDDQNKASTEQFGVRFIPFTLLIGRDGKIAAVNVRGDELEKSVVTALSK